MIGTPSPSNPYIAPDATPVPAGLASAFRPSLNAYVAAVENKAQYAQYYIERINASVGYGAISGGAVTAGAGLSVVIAPYEAVVGNYIRDTSAGTVGGLSANNSNYLFLRQDGTWTVNVTGSLPSGDGHGEALLWAIAAAGGSSVTSVDNTRAQYRPSGVGSPWLYVVASNCDKLTNSPAYATCDGVADDVEIQAAIDAAAAVGGGIVQLSGGTFYLDAPLNLKTGVVLRGDGWWRTSLRQRVATSKINLIDCLCPYAVDGTATGGSTSSLTDTTKSWATNAYAGRYVTLYDGTGKGQCALIASNTSDTLTFDGTVATAPASGTKYRISGASVATGASVSDLSLNATNSPYTGTLTGGDTLTLTQTTNTFTTNELAGNWLVMLTGPNAFQARRIASNTTQDITLYEPLLRTPCAGDTYIIGCHGIVMADNLANMHAIERLYIYAYGVCAILGAPDTVVSACRLRAYNSMGLLAVPPSIQASVSGLTRPLNLHATGISTDLAAYGGAVVGELVSDVSLFASSPIGRNHTSSAVIVNGARRVSIVGCNLAGNDTTSYVEGTASAGGSATLVDSSKSWGTNAYARYCVRQLTGEGAGQRRRIVSNNGTALTVSPNWTNAPSNGVVYRIESRTVSGVEIMGTAIGVSVVGNTFNVEANGMFSAVWCRAGSAVIVNGNAIIGSLADSYAGVVDECAGVGTAPNVSAP